MNIDEANTKLLWGILSLFFGIGVLFFDIKSIRNGHRVSRYDVQMIGSAIGFIALGLVLISKFFNLI
jgi:hypothetical protein